ncbi:MAG: hypothetical protein JSW26_29880 [Desulfobacterales bacterium]|nr:MAG: hypothetical protein JSW26_29880 [Desulfobacterales bacterium]
MKLHKRCQPRRWLFSTYYGKPITFAPDRLKDARSSLKRIAQCIYTLQHVKRGQPCPELDQLLYDIKHGFTRAMDDDLNVSAAMASLFSNIKKINMIGRLTFDVQCSMFNQFTVPARRSFTRTPPLAASSQSDR